MATVHTCDVSQNPVTSKRVIVDVTSPYDRYEFCEAHAAPILKILKKYKLKSGV